MNECGTVVDMMMVDKVDMMMVDKIVGAIISGVLILLFFLSWLDKRGK